MPYDKLVDSTFLDDGLTQIANSIRAKTGGKDELAFPTGMSEAIDSIGGGGLSAEQISALDGMFKICAYTKNAEAAYTAFKSAFGITNEPVEPDIPEEPDEPDVVTYSVSTELINATSNNGTTSVIEGASYTATLTANDGYTLVGATVKVLMGGVDITSTAYADGVIYIASVSENLRIVAYAVEIESEEPSDELVTDGLLAYFDFRTAAYNNAGAGGTTTIAPTQGNGRLFAWANNSVEVQDERGIHFANTRPQTYSQSGNTTATDIGSHMTLIVLTKGQVARQGFSYSNTEAQWGFKPKYNNVSGSGIEMSLQNGSMFNSDSPLDYNYCVYRVDGDILTEVMDTSVVTYNGKDISDFASWITTVDIGVQNQNIDGMYITAAAIYDRALTDVEIEEMRAFMKTLEVA